MKTRQAVRARFKLTGRGKLLRRHPGLRHKLAKKSPQRKRLLAKPALVSSAHLRVYRRLMGSARQRLERRR